MMAAGYSHKLEGFNMIICQVDAWLSGMRKEDIERELELLGEVFAALEGELIGAEVCVDHGRLVAYARAESELVVSDIFEVFHFTVERIAYLGWSHGTHVDFSRPAPEGTWRYRPAPAPAPAQSQPAAPPANARPAQASLCRAQSPPRPPKACG
jgi:hypothetical protein